MKVSPGSFYLLAIGIFLIVLGGVFSWLMWWSFQSSMTTRQWSQVPAKVSYSQVVSRQLPASAKEFSWTIRYIYQAEGKQYKGNKYRSRRNYWSKDLQKIQSLKAKYQEGQQIICYVNPEDSSQAVLDHDTKAVIYSIWFPLLFSVGGCGICFGVLRQMFSS